MENARYFRQNKEYAIHATHLIQEQWAHQATMERLEQIKAESEDIKAGISTPEHLRRLTQVVGPHLEPRHLGIQ
jgi:hypothetical protein